MRRLPPGCSFAPRCTQRLSNCRLAAPEPRFPGPDRMTACFRVASAGTAHCDAVGME
jgi:peptide/nickel transport system ATP-binding protein